jgi:hypothetical protein
MPNENNLRDDLIVAYCRLNDLLSKDYEGIDPRGEDMMVSHAVLAARNLIHSALDWMDYKDNPAFRSTTPALPEIKGQPPPEQPA